MNENIIYIYIGLGLGFHIEYEYVQMFRINRVEEGGPYFNTASHRSMLEQLLNSDHQDQSFNHQGAAYRCSGKCLQIK